MFFTWSGSLYPCPTVSLSHCLTVLTDSWREPQSQPRYLTVSDQGRCRSQLETILRVNFCSTTLNTWRGEIGEVGGIRRSYSSCWNHPPPSQRYPGILARRNIAMQTSGLRWGSRNIKRRRKWKISNNFIFDSEHNPVSSPWDSSEPQQWSIEKHSTEIIYIRTFE